MQASTVAAPTLNEVDALRWQQILEYAMHAVLVQHAQRWAIVQMIFPHRSALFPSNRTSQATGGLPEVMGESPPIIDEFGRNYTIQETLPVQ